MGARSLSLYVSLLILGIFWIGYVRCEGRAETADEIAGLDLPVANEGSRPRSGHPPFKHWRHWPCHPPCEAGYLCDPLHGECIPTNVCMDTCPTNEVCCGHGEDCVCPWPNRVSTSGSCSPCWCPDPQVCMSPHGDCVCPDDMVRDNQENCVHCDPEKQCPVEGCPIDRICTIHEDGGDSTCECLPGSVENSEGECTWCFPCPEECELGKICISTGFGDPYCGCPPGTKEDATGNCVNCPVCPNCDPGKDCVIRGGEATCECPDGTWEHGFECIPIHACHDCNEDEVCVLPHDGGPPYCDCPGGTVRKNGKCCPCHTHEDGHPGGYCIHGKCHGKHSKCGPSGHCECNADCYHHPYPTCIPKRKGRKRW